MAKQVNSDQKVTLESSRVPSEPNEKTRFYQSTLKQLKRKPIIIGLAVALLIIGSTIAYIALRSHKNNIVTSGQSASSGLSRCNSATATGCDKSQISPAGCRGNGPATITASPISVADLAYIQPMGLEIGGHVTPIDHGYFYINGAFSNPTAQAPVYAPLDGIVTSVTRTVRNGDPGAATGSSQRATYDDYAITVAATCTFRVVFSNLSRFAGALAAKVGQLSSNQTSMPNYVVKSGELIGYTGLPTANGIDVSVQNDQTTLSGFINPAQYTAAEPSKIHVVDFFDYTKEPLRSQLLAFDERDASPRWGKIDYSIDGKLIGNWFKVGTGGYAGLQKGGNDYWTGHLAVVYNGNDSSQIEVSFGNYQGQAQQFEVVGNIPDPAKVDQTSGLIKYELGQVEYYSGDTGQTWDNMHYMAHLRTRAGSPVGTVLMQLTSQRQLKMEIFPGKTANQVSGFDAKVLMYER